MRPFHNRLPLLCGGAACLLSFATPTFGIMTNRSDPNEIMEFFHQKMGEDYDAVVKQFAFNTTLTIEEDAGVLTGMQLTIDQQFSSFASATLVGPQYVLTAAHTVIDYGWFQYEIGGEIYRADQWWIPSGYDGEDLLFAQDIAVVRLDRVVDNVTPMNWVQNPNKNLDNAEFTMVGFGAATEAEAAAGATFIGGIRRAGENTYDVGVGGGGSGGYLDQDLNLLFDLDFPFGTLGATFDSLDDYPLQWESMVLPGDSGGPDIVDGEIVGVHSYIYPSPDPTEGKIYSASTDVRRFSTWITAIVENQDTSTGPTAFGYEFGLAGIKVEDIRADLEKDTPVLVPWLIANGYYDPFTGMGESPWGPGFDYDTGLSPEDIAAIMAVSINDTSDPAFIAALQKLEESGLADFFRTVDNDTLFAMMEEAFAAQFGLSASQVANLNTIFNPNMFGEGGIYDGFQQGTPITPEPGSAMLLAATASGLLLRRRR